MWPLPMLHDWFFGLLIGQHSITLVSPPPDWTVKGAHQMFSQGKKINVLLKMCENTASAEALNFRRDEGWCSPTEFNPLFYLATTNKRPLQNSITLPTFFYGLRRLKCVATQRWISPDSYTAKKVIFGRHGVFFFFFLRQRNNKMKLVRGAKKPNKVDFGS